MAATESERQEGQTPPRDNLVRATFPGEIGVRDVGGDTTNAMPTMTVGFARYGEWTHIASAFEGEFMERIAPGAFTKTLKENVANMRVLFEHGRDPQIGNKVLGPIAEIRDTPEGPVGEVPLLATSYNRDLVPGLREGVYGSSFRFKVMKEEFNRDAKVSDTNPDGLPERTILEAQVREFGPVTFPAYSGATAGVRSLTDDFIFGRYAPRISAEARAVSRQEVARMDSEDLATLAEMIQLGTAYIDDQDEPGDAANIPVMENVLKILAGLVPVEVQDNEPPEADDEASAQTGGTDVHRSERAAMPDGMSAMPAGVKACKAQGTPGYSGGGACHMHDGTDAGMTAAMAKAKADAKRSEDPAETETTAEAEPTHSGDTEAFAEQFVANHAEPNEPSRDTPTDDDRQPAKPETKGVATMSVIDDMRVRQTSIRSELEQISSEHSGAVLTGEVRARWDELMNEWHDLEARCAAEEERHAQLVSMAGDEKHEEAGAPQPAQERFTRTAGGTGTYVTKRDARDKTPENVFDMSAYHNRSDSQEQMLRLFGDGARRAIETFSYAHPDAERAAVNAHIERILARDDTNRELAQRLLVTGSPVYRAAFWKKATGGDLNGEELRALAVAATATGGAAVPPQIDPTLIPTANLSINPLRGIGRVFTTTSNIWKGVTSGGITAQYRAEAALMTDNAPTLTQPQLQPERADAFVPFSWELGQDWGTLETNLASELQDAKDQLEALKFSVGAGHASSEPQGILTGAGTLVTTVLGTAFSVSDVYGLEAVLPQRHIPNASWLATTGMFQKIRQFDTAGGANLWVQLQAQNPPELIGYPAYKATNIGTAGSALTATAIWGVFGDFNKFAIVDRVGMSVRFIDNLFATSSSTAQVTVPTGQSGVVAFWRNTSGVLDSNAFRVGTISSGH